MIMADRARSFPQRLAGWKEIARHLGVSVRAAQQWERTRGLPVHRLPGARGGIYAVTEELDRWAAGEDSWLRGARSRTVRERRIIRVALWTAVVVLVVGAGVGGRLWMGRHREIAAARFESGALVAADENGLDLWRLMPEPLRPGAGLDDDEPLVVSADRDGDGRKEVLGAACFKTPAEAAPEVYHHVPLIELAQGYLHDVNPVEAIEVTGSSGGWAQAVVGLEGCNVFIEFEAPLRPRAARISSGCELGHKKFEKLGVLGHPFELCPYLHDALPPRK